MNLRNLKFYRHSYFSSQILKDYEKNLDFSLEADKMKDHLQFNCQKQLKQNYFQLN